MFPSFHSHYNRFMVKYSRREGFTLVELLIVVVVIGIIGGFAIAQMLPAQEKAYVAAMKNSLNNIIRAQQNYKVQNDVFASSLAELTTQIPNFELDKDVQVVSWSASSNPAYGYTVVLGHAKSAAVCGVAYGASGPGLAAQYDNRIKCDETGADWQADNT